MNLIKKYTSVSLILRIIIGLLLGVAFGLAFDNLGFLSLLGTIFVGALKAVAPVLVFVLVIAALAQGNDKLDRRFGLVLILYMTSTLLASVIAVVGSFIFPQTLTLTEAAQADTVPSSVGEVLSNLLVNMVSNPVNSLAEGRYIGILFWAVVLGVAAKRIASDATKKMMGDISEIVSQAVRWIIQLAPFGIMGLVYENISTMECLFSQIMASFYCFWLVVW
jgi:serine/threonine transporter